MDGRLGAITPEEWANLARKAGFRVSLLAKSVNVSRQHLGRYFQQSFGVHPKAWLARQMVHDAQSHLRNREPIKEFYEVLGFRHPNNFARSFRRLTKRKPTAARAA